MAANDIKIMLNDVISFTVEDTQMAKVLSLLSTVGTLNLPCINCGLTLLPQARSHFAATSEEEFMVHCVKCNHPNTVRMYADYGFVIDKSKVEG